jgi:hypothetical protein
MAVRTYAERIIAEAQQEAAAAAKRQARREELLERQQRDAEREARRQAEYEASEQAQFTKRVLARREREAQGLPPEQVTIPTLNAVFQAEAEERLAAEMKAEAERKAAIPAREVIISTLDWRTQLHIRKWEAMNKMPFPLEALGLGAGPQ